MTRLNKIVFALFLIAIIAPWAAEKLLYQQSQRQRLRLSQQKGDGWLLIV